MTWYATANELAKLVEGGWSYQTSADEPTLKHICQALQIELPNKLYESVVIRAVDGSLDCAKELMSNRLSEALYLDWADVHLEESKAIFRDTKNNTERPAGLPSSAVAALSALPHRAGPVFLTDEGEPYEDRGKSDGGQIKTAFRGAMRRAGLAVAAEVTPWVDRRGIARERVTWEYPFTPHTCRHTWASWFYGISKDPMRLMVEGGWSSLTLVQRYAHLMPSELRFDVSMVWGPHHPAVGELPIRAQSVQINRQSR